MRFDQLRQCLLELGLGRAGLAKVGGAEAGGQPFSRDRVPLGLLFLIVGDALGMRGPGRDSRGDAGTAGIETDAD